ncbi:MAG: hypothetical protein ACOC8H_00565 [bacterium]
MTAHTPPRDETPSPLETILGKLEVIRDGVERIYDLLDDRLDNDAYDPVWDRDELDEYFFPND